MVGQKFGIAILIQRNFIRIVLTAKHHGFKTRSDLNALDGVNAHHRFGDIGI